MMFFCMLKSRRLTNCCLRIERAAIYTLAREKHFINIPERVDVLRRVAIDNNDIRFFPSF